MSKINDIDMDNWKDYSDISTDSLWIINKRDSSGNHKGDYHGNFVPQIPNQMLKRYTKKGDWVLDAFLGSGTTLIECQRLGRNGIGIDIDNEILKVAEERTLTEKGNSKFDFVNGDSASVDLKPILNKEKIENVQFIMYHPPYWDIIKFNDKEKNLSNAKTLKEFIEMFGKVVDNTAQYLEKGRYLAIVIGDIYKNSEWVPLNTYVNMLMLKKGYKLKSIVVKNMEGNRGKANQQAIWRYRALAGGFYIFKHEYILTFQKTKK